MDKGGFPVTWTITVATGVLWSLLLLYDTTWTLLPSFFCYAVFRTFLYTFLFAYIADTMGFHYFGVLAGLMFVISGIVGLLQYPLAKWAEGTCHLVTRRQPPSHQYTLRTFSNTTRPLTPSHPGHHLLSLPPYPPFLTPPLPTLTHHLFTPPIHPLTLSHLPPLTRPRRR